VELEASNQIEVQQHVLIAPSVVSQLELHRKSANLVLWDTSQRPPVQRCAHLAAQAMAPISLVKLSALSVLLESLHLEQERPFVLLAMLGRTLEKGRLNAINAVLVHMQTYQHQVAPFAQLENIRPTLE
jgi:hypothetical protein